MVRSKIRNIYSDEPSRSSVSFHKSGQGGRFQFQVFEETRARSFRIFVFLLFAGSHEEVLDGRVLLQLWVLIGLKFLKLDFVALNNFKMCNFRGT